MPPDRDDALTICHHNVLALAREAKANLLQNPEGVEVIDAGDSRRELPDLDLTNVGVLQKPVPSS